MHLTGDDDLFDDFAIAGVVAGFIVDAARSWFEKGGASPGERAQCNAERDRLASARQAAIRRQERQRASAVSTCLPVVARMHARAHEELDTAKALRKIMAGPRRKRQRLENLEYLHSVTVYLQSKLLAIAKHGGMERK